MINKVVLIGRIGAKPTLKEGKSGTKYCSFSMVTDSGFGEKKVSDWHSVTCFNKQAEFAEKYFDKGSVVFVDGRISYETYEKDGRKQKSVKIIAAEVRLISGKGQEQDEADHAQQNQSVANPEPYPSMQEDDNPFAGPTEDLGDIPF